MQVLPVVIAALIAGATAKHFSYWDEFCQGHDKCYSVWSDPDYYDLFLIDDLAHWSHDCWLPPYVSWAECMAMAATLTLRQCEKVFQLPYNILEYVSAAHILLAAQNQPPVEDFFKCTADERWGNFAGFFLNSPYLYNDQDIWFGPNYHDWCNFERYQDNLDHWATRPDRHDRYVYRWDYFYDNDNPKFSDLAIEFMAFGLHMGTLPYCPDIQTSGVLYQQDKYVCDPETPGIMWGTVIYFGVMEDSEGIWYATYFIESNSPVNRLQWTKRTQRNDPDGMTYFNYVFKTADLAHLPKLTG